MSGRHAQDGHEAPGGGLAILQDGGIVAALWVQW
jgi:hypothetical protein